MTKLLLVRHGQTEWNARRCYQGHAPVPLDETGRKQSAALAARLVQQETVDKIYASDLPRAWQTAQIINEAAGLPMESDERLRELGFGEWDGLVFTEVEERYADTLAAWLADPDKTPPPGGERQSEFVARVRSFIDEMLPQHDAGETILIVAHNLTIRLIIGLVLDLPLNKARHALMLNNCSLSEIDMLDDFEKAPVLVRLNDTCHMEEVHRLR